MARKLTLQQIDRQIADLQSKAEALRLEERAGVIDRIRVAVAHYGLTAEEIFGRSAKPPTPGRKGAGKVKYRDDAGNTWSGFGPKPKWFVAALDRGKKIEDLAA